MGCSICGITFSIYPLNLLACNYAVARFLPYPETGEFVNVGVLLACPQTGFLDYSVEGKYRARVYGFFSELPREIYDAGLHSFTEQLRHFREQVNYHSKAGEQHQFPMEKDFTRLVFAELTRPRESLFRFSSPSTVLVTDPAAKLKELFAHYVNRHFAHNKEETQF